MDPGYALQVACWNGDLAGTQHLLAAGAPLEGRDRLQRTPLFMACHGGNADVVKFLLQQGARADVVDEGGDTTIAQACEYGHLESAKLVLAAGADVNRLNKWGRTPLMLAAREGRDDVVAWLIAQHVDVNQKGNGTALFYAVWNDHFAIAKMLLDAGANEKEAAASVLAYSRRDTLLSSAAFTNDLPLIDLLIAHGASLDDTDKMGRSVLIAALQQGAKAATITHLLEKGANINAQNSEGQTPLMLALNYQPVSVLGVLLDHGAQLEMKDNRGRTALMWAAYFALDEQTHFLVEHGANVDATDKSGETALTIAGDSGAMSLVDYLKQKGAKRTDLHIIQRPPSNPPLTQAQTWALAVAAIYTQRNGTNPNVLGYDANALDLDVAQRELKDEWNITNKNQLLTELGILRDLGDRVDLQKLGARLAGLSDADFAAVLNGPKASPRRNAALQAMRANYLLWKDKLGLAFDLCRRAHMICMGFAAGYITENEAWPLLLENARMTQAAFHSWREMSDNFLDSREACTGERDPRLGACARLLQNPADPNSPWNQLPWDTNLSSADAPAPLTPH